MSSTLEHFSHPEHQLILKENDVFDENVTCSVCNKKVIGFPTYTCTIHDYDIHCKTLYLHRSCTELPKQIYHDKHNRHPLTLRLRSDRCFCDVCDNKEQVPVHSWLYYCHKCTYFVHIKCATSSVPKLNENEAAGSDTDPDLIEFPLASEESLFDLITTQCSKLQVDSDDDLRKDTITRSTEPNDLHIIEEHWSHSYHPLEQLQFITSENDDDNDDNTKVLICDGCIKPISLTYTSYYGCIQCGFFLHSVCATKLPKELPAGVSQIHPQHSLHLEKRSRFYSLVRCGVCGFRTNGFYYECETCDIIIDICCAFLPARIKHKSHKHHPLVQRPSSGSLCSVTKFRMSGGMEYACEICNNFRIGMECVFCPSTIRHKYDDHAISLRDPPFSYEGAFYCETCEEPVNNQISLFHCGECDHSFHWQCSRLQSKIKLGGTIQLDIDNELHTLAFVYKWNTRRNSPLYLCGYVVINKSIQF